MCWCTRSAIISGCPTRTWKRSRKRPDEPRSDMTTLEQLGTLVAHSRAPSHRLREILELHIADIVGAWIASLSTPEGAALLHWRAAAGEGAAPGSIHRLRLDVATHCALARLSEVDDIHL